MTSEALLKQAISTFEDKQCPVSVAAFKRAVTKQGFTYIVIGSYKKIAATIHTETNYEITENKGRQNVKTIELSTREPLKINMVVKYKNTLFFLDSYSDYNATMGQYMYKAQAIPTDLMELMKDPGDKVFGYSVFDKINEMKDYTFLPKYSRIETFENQVILYSCEAIEEFGLVRKDSNVLNQMVFEDAVFNLVNFTRAEVMTFVHRLQEFSRDFKTFGFSSSPLISQVEAVDPYSSLQSVVYKVIVKFCYNVSIDTSKDSGKVINTIVYKINDKQGVINV